MRFKYTEEQIEYVKSIAKGKNTYEITELFNERFKLDKTRNQIRNFMKNNNITTDIDRSELSKQFIKRMFNDEQHKFIEDNCKGVPIVQIAEMFNEKFGTDIKYSQMKAYMSRYKINNGRDGRIKPGNIPVNKGKKGMTMHPNAVATQFKKGQRPLNWMPVGSERVNTLGWVDIKIAEPNKWKGKHLILWEKMHGPIPENHVVIFADKNRFNFEPDNLILISRGKLATMNKFKLIHNNKEFTKTGLVIADIHRKINQLKEANKKRRKPKQVNRDEVL